MIYLGIDPGKSGGIAYIDGDDYGACKMPETERDIWETICTLIHGKNAFAFIERVGAGGKSTADGRKQGGKSMFTFGMNYGLLRMSLVAAKIPHKVITPGVWQKSYGLTRLQDETDTEKKNRHKAEAQRLFPNLKVTHATADAMLIADYCRQQRLYLDRADARAQLEKTT